MDLAGGAAPAETNLSPISRAAFSQALLLPGSFFPPDGCGRRLSWGSAAPEWGGMLRVLRPMGIDGDAPGWGHDIRFPPSQQPQPQLCLVPLLDKLGLNKS